MPRSPALIPWLLRLGIGLVLAGFAPGGVLHAAFWKAVTPEDLALERPRVDPEAGVEVLFRETEIDDSRTETTDYHTYVRLKVFNARGVEALEKIEVLETRDAPIINLAARVIRPDGRIVEVARDTIHARELMRHGSLRVRAKAFSPPGLEPGCIVEYQWDEASENSIGGLQLYFQDRFPAWRVRFRIKPFNYHERGYELVTAGFRYQIPELKPDSHGFYLFEQTEVAALREEPWMPPDDMVQSWMVLYFLRRGQRPEDFWKDRSRTLALETTRLTRPTRELEKVARELAAGASDDGEKLHRLGVFCRDEIANSTQRTAGAPPEPRSTAHKKQTAADTLLSRVGTAPEINLLFIALARAAGFEARFACVTDRSKRMFRDPQPVRFMLPDTIAAVRSGGEWRFFDPGNRHLPIGQLAWKNEGVTAMVCDRAQAEWVETPRTPPTASRVARTARLAVDATGTAIGAVVVEHRGHPAVTLRQELAALTPGDQTARMYQLEAARLGGIEIGDVMVLHADDPDRPLVFSYPVRVPHYAAATSTRLVLPLAYFQRGLARVFTAPQREHVICLPYGMEETDTVEFMLPPGFVFENPVVPAAFALPPALAYRAGLTVAGDGNGLTFRRNVSRGGMLFPVTTYRLLKQAFDDLHGHDGYAVVAGRVSADGDH